MAKSKVWNRHRRAFSARQKANDALSRRPHGYIINIAGSMPAPTANYGSPRGPYGKR